MKIGADSTPQRDTSKHVRVRRMHIDTLQEHVVYMRADCPTCRSEGLGAQARILLRTGDRELALRDAGAWRVVTCDTIAHPTNAMTVGALLGVAVAARVAAMS